MAGGLLAVVAQVKGAPRAGKLMATFRHDTSRNLDPALYTHSVIANMVRGGDGKWRSMANERLYESKMLLGALYPSELAQGLARLPTSPRRRASTLRSPARATGPSSSPMTRRS